MEATVVEIPFAYDSIPSYGLEERSSCKAAADESTGEDR